ncbi:MAG: terpene cyclase/mutase family protein [Planctomycetes bacterium]|nr:terpene cyclase/mutase family protein [Planctomycetota bacterium]
MSQDQDQRDAQDQPAAQPMEIDPGAQEPGELDGGEAQQQDEQRQGRYAGVISWVVSGALHATMLMLMGTIYFLAQEPEQEIPPVRVQNIPPPPEKKEEKPKMERELLDPKVQLDIETKSDNPSPISQLDLPQEDSQREEENDNPVPKGREEAVADSETGGQGAFMAIGAGGGASGMFGSRSGGGRKRAVGRGGGSKGSESAVEAALRWFKKHQSPNGMWDCENYPANCTEAPKCEPGKPEHTDPANANIAMTGYAVLCFLGAGYDHKTANRYRQTVKAGVEWLLSVQKPDGLLGERNYEHPIATMALAEAYAMTNDPSLRGPSQKAVDVLIARQNQDASGGYGLGWDYTKASNRNDSSVTGWCIMALKSAYAGGLNVGNSMQGAKQFVERAWKATNPGWEKLDPYTGVSDFPYCWDTKTNDYVHTFNSKDFTRGLGRDCAPMGAVCAVFLGHRSGDVMLETLGNHIMKFQTPKSYPTNTYYLYYNTMGIFQLGGDRFKVWNASVRDMLVSAQRKGEGCFDGSWDYKSSDFPGAGVGRILSTAYCCLSLEVYYRYAQVQKMH